MDWTPYRKKPIPKSDDICKQCNKHPLGLTNDGFVRNRCIRCSMKSSKTKEKKENDCLCRVCKIKFTSSYKSVICSDACLEIEKKNIANKKWSEKEYKAPHAAPLGLNERLNLSSAYNKQPSWMKKFKHVRG